tara:strand:- start:2419 stop:3918 length:1500 start_codon:yes stop_codon:yes gene_type:complete
METCIIHARDLIESAKIVHASGRSNIAYHLATLALEEVGKRELFGMQSIVSQRPVHYSWPVKHVQDHTKKLFWALFGPEFLSGTLSKDKLEKIQNLAGIIHENRLAGIYVDMSDSGSTIPNKIVDGSMCDDLIKLGEARIAMSETSKLSGPLSEEDRTYLAWYLNATDDPEMCRKFFSKGSLEKLGKLKSTRAWVRWLESLFDEAEAAAAAAMAHELERSRNLPDSGTKDKWRIRVRVFCASHSIRPKALKGWNDNCDFLKLLPVSGKKDQFFIEFTLKEQVPLESLWYLGWHIARHFVIALNIGTMGFWWWRMPEQVNRYYESIVDLENPEMSLELDRFPSLQMDWGENRALTEEDMHRVLGCYPALPAPGKHSERKAYDYYIGGLTFLSLNDIHWQCEILALGNFFSSLKAMMQENGTLEEVKTFPIAFQQFIDELFPQMDERARFLALCDHFEGGTLEETTITLKEVSFVKAFCDAFFLRKIQPTAFEKFKSSTGQ